MVIGSLTARLLVRDSRTLKDKRQVVRSILDKARAGFDVAAAEVGSLDDVKVAELAFAAVGPRRRWCAAFSRSWARRSAATRSPSTSAAT
jgi:uncharacterized protein YlxP (DUF503 family)